MTSACAKIFSFIRHVNDVFLYRIDRQRTLTTPRHIQGNDIPQPQSMRNPCMPDTDTPDARYAVCLMRFDPLAAPLCDSLNLRVCKPLDELVPGQSPRDTPNKSQDIHSLIAGSVGSASFSAAHYTKNQRGLWFFYITDAPLPSRSIVAAGPSTDSTMHRPWSVALCSWPTRGNAFSRNRTAA